MMRHILEQTKNQKLVLSLCIAIIIGLAIALTFTEYNRRHFKTAFIDLARYHAKFDIQGQYYSERPDQVLTEDQRFRAIWNAFTDKH